MNIIAIYAVIVITLFVSGFGVGHHLESEKFDTYKAEVVAEAATQKKLNEATIAQYQQATLEAQHETTTRVAAVTNLYKRLYPTTSSTSSKAGETSSGTNEYSPNNLPPTSKLAEDCAVTTVKYLTLQEWAEKVSQ